MDNGDYLTNFAKCRKEECAQVFKISAFKKDLCEGKADFEVFVAGKFFHNPKNQVALPVTGAKTKEVTQDIKKLGCREFLLQQQDAIQKKIEKGETFDGNLGYRISDNYAQKLASRERLKNDLHAEDLMDLILRQQNQGNNGSEKFIQQISLTPFYVVMINESGAKMLMENCHLLVDLDVHIDATGAIIRQLKGVTTKRIYYYSICVRIPSKQVGASGNIVELAAMVSEAHSQKYIGNFINLTKQFYAKINGQWRFLTWVTDFSFATLNAISFNFFNDTLIAYLKSKFLQWETHEIDKEFKIKLCGAHLMKNYTNDTKRTKVNKDIKHSMNRMFGIFFQIREKETYLKYLKKFLIILSSKKKNQIFVKTMNEIETLSESENIEKTTKQIETEYSEIEKVEKSKEEEDEEETFKEQYKQSPFYQEALKVVEEIEKEIENSLDNDVAENNPFYNLEFRQVFLQHYIAYAPLWINVNDSLKVSFYFF